MRAFHELHRLLIQKDIGQKTIYILRPTWKSANGHTTLTIYSSKAKIATLNERMISFIGEHQKGDLFSKAEYMKRFGVISKITAQTDIQKLVELGFCQPKGSGPSTKYLIIKTDR